MKTNRRNYLSAVLAVLFLLSCKENKETHSKDKNEKNKAIAAGFYDAFNRHDWARMADYYTDTASFLDPSFGKEFIKQTHKNTIDKYKGLQRIIPDIKDSIVNILTDSNKIAVEFISMGTLPGNKKFKLPICNVWTLKNGKIVQDATYYDNK